MAVRAAHIALFDLRCDLMPRFGACEPPYFFALRRRIPVVEVEEHRVVLATVDARMLKEVGQYQGTVCIAIAGHSGDFKGDIGITIRYVVGTSICRLAFPAVPLSCPLRDVVEGELRLRLGLAAHVAGEHGRLRGTVANTSGQLLEHLF